MKRMKRVVTGLLALVMMFALVACGGKEQTVTYRGEQEESGIKMVDTMTFTAKGDKVQKLVEKIEMDVSSFEDDMKEQLKTVYDGMVEQYNAVEGVKCSMESGDDSITLSIEVDTTGDAAQTLADQGLLELTGGSNISLKASGSALEEQGYEKVE